MSESQNPRKEKLLAHFRGFGLPDQCDVCKEIEKILLAALEKPAPDEEQVREALNQIIGFGEHSDDKKNGVIKLMKELITGQEGKK